MPREDCGHESGKHHRCSGREGRDGEDVQIDGDRPASRNILGEGRRYGVKPADREGHPGSAANGREEPGFSHQLPRQATSACAKGHSYADFAAAAGRARELQAGDVGCRHKQE